MGSVFLDLFIYTIRSFLTTLINNKCILSARKFVEVLFLVIESRYFLPQLFFSEGKTHKQLIHSFRTGISLNILNKVKDKERFNELDN